MTPPSTPDNADVRLRGFASRTTVEAVWNWIDAALPPPGSLAVEETPLLAAAGCVAARNVASAVSVPAFPRAMMDGIAVRAEETQGASTYNPRRLKVLGVCLPGRGYSGAIGSGETVRIMTGAPLPAGADAVLPFEQVQLDGEYAAALAEVSPQKHVGQIGEDVTAGDVVLRAGRVLRPQDLGLLSSLGVAAVPVIRRPSVRIVITGDELLPMGTPPRGYQIPDANGPLLAALVARDGGVAVMSPIVRDDRAALLAAMREPCDMLIVAGGSSVGQEDHVPTLLAEHGELAVHGVAMRPSSPTGMGRLDGRLVFLLPGNPVSCLCAYDFFAGRAIRALAGRSTDWPYRRVRAVLTRKINSVVGRLDYARVRLFGDEAEPLAIGGASVLSSLTRADGFIIVPADSEGHPAGAAVDVLAY